MTHIVREVDRVGSESQKKKLSKLLPYWKLHHLWSSELLGTLRHRVVFDSLLLFGPNISVRNACDDSTRTGTSRRRRLSPRLLRSGPMKTARRVSSVILRRSRSTAKLYACWCTLSRN